jgi:hypothetical protein
MLGPLKCGYQTIRNVRAVTREARRTSEKGRTEKTIEKGTTLLIVRKCKNRQTRGSSNLTKMENQTIRNARAMTRQASRTSHKPEGTTKSKMREPSHARLAEPQKKGEPKKRSRRVLPSSSYGNAAEDDREGYYPPRSFVVGSGGRVVADG